MTSVFSLVQLKCVCVCVCLVSDVCLGWCESSQSDPGVPTKDPFQKGVSG